MPRGSAGQGIAINVLLIVCWFHGMDKQPYLEQLKNSCTRYSQSRKEYQMSKPAFTLRDGSIKATAWANTSDKGMFYSIDITRGYMTDNGEWKDTTSFSGGDALRASNLLKLAYNRTLQLKADAKEQN